ncbi:MAG TPA: hypothetical protein VEC12_02060 [Bacteroidia bacterium]|nr:hypothetical protein [Bacteroidia bacterium]
MKRLAICALLFTAAFFSAKSQTDSASKVDIKPGTKLVYDVNANGNKYQFVVTVKNLGNGITFDWTMTTPDNLSGTVEMTPGALDTAHALYNFFTGGMTKLADQTSVWVSTSVWKDIHDEDEMTDLKLDSETEDSFIRFAMPDGYATTYKGTPATMASSELRSLFTDNVITVWENEKFPIILKMNLGWTIELREIK